MKFVTFVAGGQRYLLTELPAYDTPTHLAPHRSGWDGLSCIKTDGTVYVSMLPEGQYEFLCSLKYPCREMPAYQFSKKILDGNYALLKIL